MDVCVVPVQVLVHLRVGLYVSRILVRPAELLSQVRHCGITLEQREVSLLQQHVGVQGQELGRLGDGAAEVHDHEIVGKLHESQDPYRRSDKTLISWRWLTM